MKELIDFCKKTAQQAGEQLLLQTVTVTRHKTVNDLLTENDIRIEQWIVDRIAARFPDVNIVSEESNPNRALKGRSVVIDPIDGTCNYAVGSERFGIQLAIFEEEICRASVLYFPKRKELIYAIKGQGAFCNGKRLHPDAESAPSDGMLLISDYYSDLPIPMNLQFDLVQSLQSVFLKTRHLGAACEDFASLAKGQGLAYICYYHYIWDIAPGLLLAQECGYCYSTLDGSDYQYGEPGLVVANNKQTLGVILEHYQQLCAH